jgi:hypothetical protein
MIVPGEGDQTHVMESVMAKITAMIRNERETHGRT